MKTPGDGWAYSVGSIEVRDTGVAGPVFFSGVAAEPALTLPPFGVGPGVSDRQVVMLQQAGVADDSIGFQRFFYGTNPSAAPNTFRPTTARGIAVWPDPDPLEQRIVICGESFDELLPTSNVPTGWAGANGTATAGFIALFNGAGDLLWSHQFFGPLVDGQCAITDVAIRVGVDGLGNPIDVVTFCGLSNYGNPVQNDTLTTVRPFAAPPVSPTPPYCGNSTAGDTDNGPGQFDGIVGVLSHPHSLGAPSAATTTVEYLSVVGGSRDDGLFGIAEIDENHFAVVGSTGGGATGTGNGTFPVTLEPLACPNPTSPEAGVICVFRTDPASLVLEVGQLIRSGNPGVRTGAKDVLMQRSWGANGEPGLIVVGATEDPQLLAQVNWGSSVSIGPDGTLGGTEDGFVLAGELYLGASPASTVPVVSWTHGTYQGTDAADYATGVQGWSEYYDHFVVAGTWTTEPSPGVENQEIVVASYYRPPSQTGPVVPLVQLGSAIIGGLDQDSPATIGPQSATGNNNYGTVGTATGGGVAVDANARVSVVGATYVQSYPAPPYSMSTFPTTAAPNPAGRASMSTAVDAVRASFDLLPSDAVAGAFVGRTDGTGPIQGPPGGPVGGYPTGNWSGATTPECAITPFGHQIGVADPQAAPALPRMLIDWEGPAPGPGNSFAIVISRHPQQTVSAASVIAVQLGFPGDPDLFPVLLPGGAEMWVPQYSLEFAGITNPNWESMRFPFTLPVLPGPSFLTLQAFCLLATPVTGGTSPACATTSDFAATPALWLSY